MAFANAAGFAAYIVLGHRIANQVPLDAGGDGRSTRLAGVDRLGMAMLIAAVFTSIWGLAPAIPAFAHPVWVAWGIGVGLCSSVIPYVADQLAMSMLGRAAYALMMALLPASAVIIGAVVLHQLPTPLEAAGIGLVIIGIVLHTDRAKERPRHAGERPAADER